LRGQFDCIIRGTNVPRHFDNFQKFTKSLRQYLGHLITNNGVFSSFVSDDFCVVYPAHRLGP